MVYPQPEIIELIQDKRKQKTFYKANRIPTSDFVLTEDREDVSKHADMLPAVNKLGTEGYDGRGVQMIHSVLHSHQPCGTVLPASSLWMSVCAVSNSRPNNKA